MASQPVRLLGFSSSEFRFEHPAACAENQKKPHSKGVQKVGMRFFSNFPRPLDPVKLLDWDWIGRPVKVPAVVAVAQEKLFSF